MHRPDADTHELVTVQDNGRLPRRSFLKQLTTALGSFILWRSPVGDSATAPRLSPTLTSTRHPTLKYLPENYQKYPMPTYLPKDYQLVEVFTDRLDGFGSDSGELAFWYVNPRHPLGFNSPLSIYVTPQPKRAAFGTTEHHTGTPVILSMPSNTSVQAKYYDGFWVLSLNVSGPLPKEHIMLPDGDGVLIWSTSNLHSLTFRLRDFTIGVRGAWLTGVNYDELIRVASSIV